MTMGRSVTDAAVVAPKPTSGPAARPDQSGVQPNPPGVQPATPADRRVLATRHVVFVIIAAAAPMAAMVGNTPLALLPDHLGDLLFNQADAYVGELLKDIMGVLLCTSLLASMVAVHNASARYLFALGRERLLPARLGRSHPRHAGDRWRTLVFPAVGAIGLATAFVRLLPDAGGHGLEGHRAPALGPDRGGRRRADRGAGDAAAPAGRVRPSRPRRAAGPPPLAMIGRWSGA